VANTKLKIIMLEKILIPFDVLLIMPVCCLRC
jgi:hypothetical protein